MNERRPNLQEYEDCSGWQRLKTQLLWLTRPSNSTHRKRYKSKLLFVHSRGSRCKFWGLLHCDDRRLRWWASSDGPQHDRSRSDTGMINVNFNSYASLFILFIIPVLLYFVFDHDTMYTTRVLTCLIFLTVREIEESLKNSDCPFHFFLGFSSLLTL